MFDCVEYIRREWRQKKLEWNRGFVVLVHVNFVAVDSLRSFTVIHEVRSTFLLFRFTRSLFYGLLIGFLFVFHGLPSILRQNGSHRRGLESGPCSLFAFHVAHGHHQRRLLDVLYRAVPSRTRSSRRNRRPRRRSNTAASLFGPDSP